MLQGDRCRVYPVWWGLYPVIYDPAGLPGDISQIRQAQYSVIKPTAEKMTGRSLNPTNGNDVRHARELIQPAYGKEHGLIRPETSAELQKLQTQVEKLIETSDITLPTDDVLKALNHGRKRGNSDESPSSKNGEKNREKKRAKTAIDTNDLDFGTNYQNWGSRRSHRTRQLSCPTGPSHC